MLGLGFGILGVGVSGCPGWRSERVEGLRVNCGAIRVLRSQAP